MNDSSWINDLKEQIKSAENMVTVPLTAEERRRYWPEGMPPLTPDFLIGDFAIIRIHNRYDADR